MADTWEKLEAEATAGPWRHVVREGAHRVDTPSWPVADCGFGNRDAALIVHLRNRSPQLRALRAAARAGVAAVDALVDSATTPGDGSYRIDEETWLRLLAAATRSRIALRALDEVT